MAKISTGNVLDPRRSGPITTEEFLQIATEVVAKLARLSSRKWQYGVRLSDRRNQGADVVLKMDVTRPGWVGAEFGGKMVGEASLTLVEGVVARSEANWQALSDMLQNAAADTEVLSILQQL